MTYTRVNGVDIHAEVTGGTDRWVTLVPGITNDLHLWDELVPALTSFCRVLRFDARGHGLSRVSSSDYSASDLMADITGLWDAIGIETSHVVGLGFGGSLAMGLAATQPRRLLSLTGVVCRPVLTPEFIELWTKRAHKVSTDGIESIVDDTVSRWFTPSFAETRPAVFERVKHMVAGTSVAGYVGHARAFATIDWSAELRQIRVPTLLISAAGDPGGGRSDVMQAMADSMPSAAHVTIPQAGHICNIENPTAFNTAIRDFITSLEL
jgi:3-oxoadipate enol-lactonase